MHQNRSPMILRARLTRHLAIAWVVAMATCGGAVLAGETPGSDTNASPDQAKILVQDTTARILEAIRRRPELATESVEEIVIPTVDLVRVSHLVLGKYWKNATEQQRQRFMEEMSTQLVRTYAIGLTEYLAVSEKSGTEIDYLPILTRKENRDATIRTQVGEPGMRMRIDYRLYRSKDEWKVYDLLIEGVSIVLTFRRSYAAEARKGGIDRVIDQITAKNLQPSPA